MDPEDNPYAAYSYLTYDGNVNFANKTTIPVIEDATKDGVKGILLSANGTPKVN